MPEQKPTQELNSIGIVFISLAKCMKSAHAFLWQNFQHIYYKVFAFS